jgi:hypothetical protein
MAYTKRDIINRAFEEIGMGDKFPDFDRLHSLLRYDMNTGKLFWKFATSNRVKVGDEAGTIYKNGYKYVSVDGHRILAHRLIFFMLSGFWPDGQVDHRDNDRLNNKIENLRACSPKQNAENKKHPQSNNSFGVLGVSPSRGKFRAQIQVNGKNQFLGRYETLDKAQAVYLSAKKSLHEGYVQ